jgi:hypothetical protein
LPENPPPAAEELPPVAENAPEGLPQAALPAVDQLPEFEELTPELMEDECLRGDVMLRWATVLLALLAAWTYVTETPILVQIKTGEAILARGGLPPRTDSFSATASGRPWVNLGWLSDVLLAGIHQAGMHWLTVLAAATIAGAIWALTSISLPGISTWWPSVCAALALLALFPVFQPGPASITALGLALLCWLLYRWTVQPDCKRLWGLPVLFALWTNLDPRCWIGLTVLVLFAIGAGIGAGAERRGALQRLWTLAGVSLVLGLLLTPWPGLPALQPVTTLRTLGAIQGYEGNSENYVRLLYGLLNVRFWLLLDVFAASALLLFVISLATLILNAPRLHRGWGLAWLGINLLPLLYGEAVCYAAVVNAAVAALCGQDWYRHSYSLAYAIDTGSVVWARAGRALTVLSLFFAAYITLNGVLPGVQGRRVGMGLDPRWQNRIASLEHSVLPGAYSDRIFPTIPAQGDLLIWLGKKPFLDSRYAIYVSGENSLLDQHRAIRTALFARAEEGKPAPDPAGWKAPLAELKVYDVLTRLWGAPPPYETMLRLMTSPDWTMTGLGAAGANFTRVDLAEPPELKAFAAEHRASRFSVAAFRPAEQPTLTHLSPTWPAPPSDYEQWLYQKMTITPPPSQLAAHYEIFLSRLKEALTPQQAAGLALLAIRDCRQALADDPNHPLAYRVLINAYSTLQQIEEQAALAAGQRPGLGVYQPQIMAAAFGAAKAGREDAGDLLRLYQVLAGEQEWDTARKVLARLDRALGRNPQVRLVDEQRKQLDESRLQLDDGIEQMRLKIDDARAQGASRPQLVAIALQGGCPSLALSILEEDLTEVSRNDDLQLLYASLLLRTGEIQNAYNQVESMGDVLGRKDLPPALQAKATQWRNIAGTINAAAHDLDRSLQLWKDDQRSALRLGIKSLLEQPFAGDGVPQQLDLWAALKARLSISADLEIPERWAQLQLQCARAELEIGRPKSAASLLETLLERHPEFSQRAIAVFYLNLLTDKNYDARLPKRDDVPLGPDLFAPEEPPQTPAATDKPMPSPAGSPAAPADKPAASPEKPAENPAAPPKTPAASAEKPAAPDAAPPAAPAEAPKASQDGKPQ